MLKHDLSKHPNRWRDSTRLSSGSDALKEPWTEIRAAGEPSRAEADPFSLVQPRLDIPT